MGKSREKENACYMHENMSTLQFIVI